MFLSILLLVEGQGGLLHPALPLGAADTTTILPLSALYSPDVPMNCNPLQSLSRARFSALVPRNCQLGPDFQNRGFCVSTVKTKPDITGQGQACRSASVLSHVAAEAGTCATRALSGWVSQQCFLRAHKTSDYTVNGNGIQDVVNIVCEAMVAQVRAGLNNNVTCPKRLGLAQSSQECPPGGGAHAFAALAPGNECPKALRHQFDVPYGRGLCVVKGDEAKGYACFAPRLLSASYKA